jgi:hypothetical protein
MKKNTIHFESPGELKKRVMTYCERHDITISQFGRWAAEYFLRSFPKQPPVGGVPHVEEKNSRAV